MMNRAVLVGRVVRDPELRKTTTSGTPVATFTLAVDNRVRAGGERTTSFIPCTCWSQTAEIVKEYVKKGSLIGIDGRLHQRSYTASDGRKISVVEVVADTVTFLEKKQNVAQSDRNDSQYDSAEQSVDSDAGIDVTTDNDLPF